MDASSTIATASPRLGWPARPIAIVLAGTGLFCASAYMAGRLLAQSPSAIMIQGSVVVLLAAMLGLAALAGFLKHARRYRDPLRRLEEILREIRAGRAPVEELSRVDGALASVTPLLGEILRDLRSQQTRLAELQAEMRQRVAQRTDALERTIGSLRQQAARDPLTGLYNRRMLDQCLQAAIARCREVGAELCVLMADLDHFKPLNDTLGHAAGDQMLRSVGQIIRSTVREQDLAFRCGGDEFVILLPASAQEAGQSLKARLASLVDALGRTTGLARPMRWSAGLVSLSELPSATAAELLAEADRRLYREKAGHRGMARNP